MTNDSLIPRPSQFLITCGMQKWREKVLQIYYVIFGTADVTGSRQRYTFIHICISS